MTIIASQYLQPEQPSAVSSNSQLLLSLTVQAMNKAKEHLKVHPRCSSEQCADLFCGQVSWIHGTVPGGTLKPPNPR